MACAENLFCKRYQSVRLETTVSSKNFTFSFSEIVVVYRHPASHEGRTRRHDTRGGDAVDVKMLPDERHRCGREIVWS
jgi:hypothetical protein